MTRAATQLKTGDRVHLIRPIAGLRVGTPGIILRRFTFDPLYDVCFDGHSMPRLVNPRDLAPAPLEVPTV